jgi:hypothetical protein
MRATLHRRNVDITNPAKRHLLHECSVAVHDMSGLVWTTGGAPQVLVVDEERRLRGTSATGDEHGDTSPSTATYAGNYAGE